MSTSPLFWLRPLFICLTSQLYLWEYIWSSQQILTSLFGSLQIKAHLSKFNLVFRSRSVLESLRMFGLALNLWKWQCSEGVVWFGFNELFSSLFLDNSWCPYNNSERPVDALAVKKRLITDWVTTWNQYIIYIFFHLLDLKSHRNAVLGRQLCRVPAQLLPNQGGKKS